MKVKIITDSISEISIDVANAYDIEVLPIEMALGDSFARANELEVIETAKWIESNKKRPSFKGVSTETYASAFEKYVKQGMEIVCVTAGSNSISNYDCACHASTRFPNANIHVIDSHQVSVSVGIMAIKAAMMAQNGESANSIAIMFERNMDKFKQHGLAESVDYLQYAGLCPKLVAVGSNLLNAKFEFELKPDKQFDVKLIGNSMNKAIVVYTNNIFKNLRAIDPKKIFMSYTLSDEDYFAEMYKRVLALNYFEDIIVCSAGHFGTSILGRSGISIAYELK